MPGGRDALPYEGGDDSFAVLDEPVTRSANALHTKEIAFILDHCGARMVLVEDALSITANVT